MSAVRPEPLALEVTLAHYVASLPEGKSVALADLAGELGTSVDELRGALEAVIEVEDSDLTTISGAVIEDGRLVKYLRGGYEEDFRRPVRLSPVQGRAALLALDLISRAADPGIVDEIRAKVLTSVGHAVPRVEADAGANDISEAIDLARRESRLLKIRYPSSGEVSDRRVEPLLMSSIDGVWYLNAFCRRAEAPRLFRLDRILDVRVLDERFEEREGSEIKTDFEDIDPRSYATRRAVVRFSPNVARWMEERPELDFVETHADGSADYALHYTDPTWAAKRVMRYLGEAAVLEPEELRREVRERASTLLAVYEART